jgi:hypothetical protein
MKAFLYSLVFVSILAGHVSAQNPEFYLVLRHYFNDQLWPHPLYLGYDPAASDSLEGVNAWLADKGGEQELPPFFGDNDVRFSDQVIERDSSFGNGSWMDIRHKPDSASFQLTYEISFIVSSNFQYASMLWANSVIPPIIHNMILEPATVSPEARTKTDMKQVSEIVFPNRDSINKYRFMLITLYYNRDYLSTVVDGKEAVRVLTIVANPVSHWLSAVVHAEKSQQIGLSLFDINGRVVCEKTIRGEVGLNPVDIDCSRLPNGAYKLVAFVGQQSYSQTVIVNK